jgi:hypothetical protein
MQRFSGFKEEDVLERGFGDGSGEDVTGEGFGEARGDGVRIRCGGADLTLERGGMEATGVGEEFGHGWRIRGGYAEHLGPGCGEEVIATRSARADSSIR